jgi:hypothetical protein
MVLRGTAGIVLVTSSLTVQTKIPLNPPFPKGDFKPLSEKGGQEEFPSPGGCSPEFIIDKMADSRILKNMHEYRGNQAGWWRGESLSTCFFGFYFTYFRSLRPGA